VTKWPGDLHLAAMFDPTLVGAFGAAVAQEHRAKGVSVMLGPGVCLTRVPTGGRNWECVRAHALTATAGTPAHRVVRHEDLTCPSVPIPSPA
jgi:beta-glucosidase